jgi:hypothetical protein
MDVMELVENEPNARPFQCDWQTCSKVCGSLMDDVEAGTDRKNRASTGSPIFKDIIESTQTRDHTHA